MEVPPWNASIIIKLNDTQSKFYQMLSLEHFARRVSFRRRKYSVNLCAHTKHQDEDHRITTRYHRTAAHLQQIIDWKYQQRLLQYQQKP